MNFHHSQFLQQREATEFSLLGNIPEIINKVDNINLCRQPTLDEILKKMVFNLTRDSSSGFDGLSIAFYQCYWDIVGNNIFKIVQNFLRGNSLPKFITLTNLVLLSKKK